LGSLGSCELAGTAVVPPVVAPVLSSVDAVAHDLRGTDDGSRAGHSAPMTPTRTARAGRSGISFSFRAELGELGTHGRRDHLDREWQDATSWPPARRAALAKGAAQLFS